MPYAHASSNSASSRPFSVAARLPTAASTATSVKPAFSDIYELAAAMISLEQAASFEQVVNIFSFGLGEAACQLPPQLATKYGKSLQALHAQICMQSRGLGLNGQSSNLPDIPRAGWS